MFKASMNAAYKLGLEECIAYQQSEMRVDGRNKV